MRRAITSMRDLGLLRWERRLVRNGWRCAQTSNATAWPSWGTPCPEAPPGGER